MQPERQHCGTEQTTEYNEANSHFEHDAGTSFVLIVPTVQFPCCDPIRVRSQCDRSWCSVQARLRFRSSLLLDSPHVKLRIATWNINSLRLRLPLLKQLIAALE